MTGVIEAPTVDTPTPPRSRRPGTPPGPVDVPLTRTRMTIRILVLVLLVATIASLQRVGVNPITLWQERDDVFNLIDRMVPPRIDEPALVWKAAVDTFLMAVAGTAIGVLLAIPVAIGSASNLTSNRVIRSLSRGIIVGTRALPDLVLAMILVRIYSIGVIPGVLALGIHSVGMLGKLFSDSIEQIDPGPREGVQATGAGRVQEFTTGVWPQVLPSMIAVALYRLDINFRSATLLGLVGAGGIGLQINAAKGRLDYPQLLGVTLVIIALILAVEVVSTSIRSRILGHGDSKGSMLDKWLRRTPDAKVFVPAADRQPSHGDDAPVPPSDVERDKLRPPWTRDRISMSAFGLGTLVLLVLAFIIPDISFIEMVRGLPEVPVTFLKLVPTSLDWWDAQYGGLLIETVAMGFGATGLALVFALPTSLLAARNVAPARWIYQGSRLFILLARSLPDLIVAVIFVAALGLGPKPGVLALAIGLYAFATKLFADAIEEVDDGPRDGVRATGASGLQELTTSVLPQAMPSIVGNSLYLLDVSIRSSTVLGIVGAGGIGFTLIQGMKLLRFELVGGLLIMIFVIVYLIELLAVWIRRQVI